MSKPKYAYEGLTLSVKHEPDTLTAEEQKSANPREQGAGFLVIGVEIDGAFVPLERRKAAGVLADIKRAKQSKSQKPDDSQD